MLLWIGFIIFIGILLSLDLGVFNRESHVISTKEALGWTTLWTAVSLLFSFFVFFAYRDQWFGLGAEMGHVLTPQSAVLKYLTGYLVELSLSVDNIFVIALIFSYFHIPRQYQHRVLFWGIVGAIIFRGFMIGAGVYLIERFSLITYVFGAILLYSAYRMLGSGHEKVDPDKNPVVNFFKRYFPIVRTIHKEHFFLKRMGKTYATPLFIALLVVETTDVMFAFDSIPAIFAITTDPFLVFSSNIFAILGLRSLFFVLVSILNRFKYLQYSLVGILAFVGVKMLLIHLVHLPEWVSFAVIVAFLGGGILFSLAVERREKMVEELKS
ncbi:MAG: TerC family protein [Lewinellaceae bacterium]|nr:TerC family protein [Lewinellaceae bacterium]